MLVHEQCSLNIYCFSKIWFRTHSVDLREGDINKITSSAKTWLYGDMLFKPDEIVLHRPTSYGGLSLLNVKMKALAGLIRTFLETACMPKFRQSLYHQLLFRYHVLFDRTIENPGYPQFYSMQFFSIIQNVHFNTSLSVASMTEKQWYHLLVEENITMTEAMEETRQYRPCRVEIRSPEIDWNTTWSRTRLQGLGPELMSFIFKVIHDLLPTQVRLARTSPTISGMCKLCQSGMMEDQVHALIRCPGNQGIGEGVLQCLPEHDEGDDQLALLLQHKLDQSHELPVVWFLAEAWRTIWESRTAGKRPELYKVRADLEAKVSLLRETRRHREASEIIITMIARL